MRDGSQSVLGAEPAIAVCFNAAFLPHAATALYSLAVSQQSCGPVFLVTDGVPDAELQRLVAFAKSHGLDPQPLTLPEPLIEGFVDTNLSRVTWYRTALPEALPDHDRLIYLDTDLIVLHDLGALWNTRLEDDHLFGAVAHPSYWGVEAHVAHLQMPPGARLFNGGVLLMDLARMRAAGFGPRVRELAAEPAAATFKYHEQDTMNVAFAGQWTQLDPIWNCLSSMAMPFLFNAEWTDDTAHEPAAVERAARSPAVVHFEGVLVMKPWHVRSFHPYRNLYREYRAATPWPLDELERRSTRDTVLTHLPPRLQAKVWSLKRRLTAKTHTTNASTA